MTQVIDVGKLRRRRGATLLAYLAPSALLLALTPPAIASANECDMPLSLMPSDQATVCRQFSQFWYSVKAQNYEPASNLPTILRASTPDDQPAATIFRPLR